MNKIKKYSLAFTAFLFAGVLGACNEFKPETPELPNLPKVSNLKAEVSNRIVNLSWQLPSTSLDIEGVSIKINNNQEISLVGAVTNYGVRNQPMEYENMYTVKIKYKGGYVSEGESVMAMVPYEDLANVSDLVVTNIEGRTVTLSWTLPNANDITGVYVGIDGEDTSGYSYFEGLVTTVTLKKQPNGQSVRYRVLVQYDGYYTSAGNTCPADIPFVETKMGFLLLADSPAQLPDDDELAAAAWFSDQPNAEFVTIDQIPSLDPEELAVIWIMVDRTPLPHGLQNLPSELTNDESIQILKDYLAAGGNLYLAKAAVQLTEPLGIVPPGLGPTGNDYNEGGPGDDVWTINPYLGWRYRPGGTEEGKEEFYDRTGHQIFAGLLFEDPNGYGYQSIPLEGPGFREDHNTIWDCNVFGRGDENNVIKYFENQTNSVVLATWGHVTDHCIAGLVEFLPNLSHGRVIANGFAAYEFEQNSGVNPYQDNINKLTENILNYLK